MRYTIIHREQKPNSPVEPGQTGQLERPYELERGSDGQLRLTNGEERVTLDVRYLPDGDVHLLLGNVSHDISVGLDKHEAICAWLGRTLGLDIYNDRQLRILRLEEVSAGGFQPNVESPMAGKVIAVKVAPGDDVEENDALAIVEAMKMENIIRAQQKARVERLAVDVGEAVEPGQTLLVLAPRE